MQTPHDRYFRHVFSSPRDAEGELRHLLPSALVARIDWSTLTPLRTDVVGEQLQEKRTDVAFSVKVLGKQLVLYLLLEHQSTPEVWMVLRVLEYMTGHWRKVLQDAPDKQRLPPIIGFVIYHGQSGWTCATRLSELVDAGPELAALVTPYVPNFEYVLDDLSKARSEEVKARAASAVARLALVCLSRARLDPDYLPLLLSQLDLLRQVASSPNGVAALSATVSYILEVTETQPTDVHQLFRELGPNFEEAYMTGAQILTQEAHEKGIEKGIEQGQRQVLQMLLTERFGQLPDTTVAKLDGATKAELDLWLVRVLTAKSLDEVFA